MEEVKKIVAIHDLSGLGRCSLTAAIPVISVQGIQVCPFPTAILSCQTGYTNFSFLDLANEMENYKKSLAENAFEFSGIYTGFLGSERQIDIVKDFINSQGDIFVLVDPVMGDNGEVYKTYTKNMCDKMKDLVSLANVVTPNLTEACILANIDYDTFIFTEGELLNISKKITRLGPKKIVITGIVQEDKIYNFAYESTKDSYFITECSYNGESFSGTGDVFSSVLCGRLMNNFDFNDAVNEANNFVKKCIDFSKKFVVDNKNGVIFEPLLKELII